MASYMKIICSIIKRKWHFTHNFLLNFELFNPIHVFTGHGYKQILSSRSDLWPSLNMSISDSVGVVSIHQRFILHFAINSTGKIDHLWYIMSSSTECNPCSADSVVILSGICRHQLWRIVERKLLHMRLSDALLEFCNSRRNRSHLRRSIAGNYNTNFE